MAKLSAAITLVFRVTWFYRNLSDFWYSRNISYQCWKSLDFLTTYFQYLK